MLLATYKSTSLNIISIQIKRNILNSNINRQCQGNRKYTHTHTHIRSLTRAHKKCPSPFCMFHLNSEFRIQMLYARITIVWRWFDFWMQEKELPFWRDRNGNQFKFQEVIHTTHILHQMILVLAIMNRFLFATITLSHKTYLKHWHFCEFLFVRATRRHWFSFLAFPSDSEKF